MPTRCPWTISDITSSGDRCTDRLVVELLGEGEMALVELDGLAHVPFGLVDVNKQTYRVSALTRYSTSIKSSNQPTWNTLPRLLLLMASPAWSPSSCAMARSY